MSLDVVTTLIGNYVFPIVACLAMAWYVKYISDKNRETTEKLNESHTQEMLAYKEEIREALNNNTMAINKLCEKLEGRDRYEDEQRRIKEKNI